MNHHFTQTSSSKQWNEKMIVNPFLVERILSGKIFYYILFYRPKRVAREKYMIKRNVTEDITEDVTDDDGVNYLHIVVNDIET